MQCKNHPDRQAEHFCARCGLALCKDCVEEVKPGVHCCFQCAMLQSVSDMGTTIRDKREKASKKKSKEKKKWGPFQYFVITSSVLILVMWGVILFGEKEMPVAAVSFEKQPRLLLFMVDSSLKRYAYYEGKKYPERLADLTPKYLALRDTNLHLLEKLAYRTDSKAGYYLSFAKPISGEMNITITPNEITFHTPSGGDS